MRKRLQELKDNFVQTMEEAAEIVGLSPNELTRDQYIRACVDFDVDFRLNKEQLNVLGGFKALKEEFFSLVPEAEGPKILVLDIETKPLIAAVWSIWQQNVGLNMIESDWSILSYAAKWLGDDEIFYEDQRDVEDIEDDRALLGSLWELLDEADFVLTQNGVKFDIPKINARFIMNGMNPPSSYRQIDTKKIAKKNFAFTSNKLEYMTGKLCTKKKLKHARYPGFELWKQCMAGNQDAWDEMENYNIQDIVSLEELYQKLAPWDSSINFALYNNNLSHQCTCGEVELEECGFYYTNSAKYQKYRCVECGREVRGSENLANKRKKGRMKKTVTRHR